MPYTIRGPTPMEGLREEEDAYPVRKEDLIEEAIKKGAAGDFITMLEDFPLEAFTDA